jgi:hypothetical protein
MHPTIEHLMLYMLVYISSNLNRIYISIPHSEIKLQKFCSDHKIDNTIEFVVSNYPKMTVSTLRSDSGTTRPKRNFVSVFMPCNQQ